MNSSAMPIESASVARNCVELRDRGAARNAWERGRGNRDPENPERQLQKAKGVPEPAHRPLRTCPAASVRRDAKFVLTMVLIWSAALPINAGSMSAEIRRSPGSWKSIRGWIRKALAPDRRKLPQQLKQAAREHPDRHADDRACRGPAAPVRAPTSTEPTLKKIDAVAGMPYRSQALSSPIACAASAISTRNGNMTRVSSTASSNLPGHVFEARRHQPDELRREEHSRRANGADHQDQRRGREVRELLRLALSAGLQVLRKDRDERRRERAFGEKVARQVRNPHSEQERVVNLARAEQARHDHLARHPGNPAHRDGGGDRPGGTDEAVILHALLGAPDFDVFVHFLRLRQVREGHSRQPRGGGARRRRPSGAPRRHSPCGASNIHSRP